MTAPLVLLNPRHKRHGQRLADRCRVRVAFGNPTLVHHGYAQRADWHVTTEHHAPIADLYFPSFEKARAVGKELARLIGTKLTLFANQGVPDKTSLERHPHAAVNRRANPKGRNPGGVRHALGKLLKWQRYGHEWRATTSIGDYYIIHTGAGYALKLNTYEPIRGRRSGLPVHWTDLGVFPDTFAARREAMADLSLRAGTAGNPKSVRPGRNAKGRKSRGNPVTASSADRLLALAQAAWDRGEKAKAQKLYEAAWSQAGDARGRRVNRRRSRAARHRVSLRGPGTSSVPKRRAARKRHAKRLPRPNPRGRNWTVRDAKGRIIWRGRATAKAEALLMAERSRAGRSDPPGPWKATRDNPAPSKWPPLVGEKWRDLKGRTATVKMVAGNRVQVLDSGGRREWLERRDFQASYRPPVISNPRGTERARKTFRMWQDRDVEPRSKRVRRPPPLGATAVQLGELASVDYLSDKYTGQRTRYTHEFSRPRPLLVTDQDGRHPHIVGGRVKITADGLEN